MAKKLIDFTWDEVDEMDKILFELNSEFLENGIEYRFLLQRMEGLPKKFEDYIKFLNRNWYISVTDFITRISENEDIPTSLYKLNPKGRIVCERGGLLLLYERQRSDKENSLIAKKAMKLSILAIILSAIIPISIELIKLLFD